MTISSSGPSLAASVSRWLQGQSGVSSFGGGWPHFGDTLSHSALLGVAIALLLEVNITLSVFFISVTVALLLLLLQRRASLSSDALLGLLAHATLAVGLVVLAFMSWSGLI